MLHAPGRRARGGAGVPALNARAAWPVVLNCVGARNNRTFVALVACIFVGQVLILRLAAAYLRRLLAARLGVPAAQARLGIVALGLAARQGAGSRARPRSGNGAGGRARRARAGALDAGRRVDGRRHGARRRPARAGAGGATASLRRAVHAEPRPGAGLLMEVGARQVPLTTGNCVLVLRCALCILANLTTNELIGRRRYGFLKARPPKAPRVSTLASWQCLQPSCSRLTPPPPPSPPHPPQGPPRVSTLAS